MTLNVDLTDVAAHAVGNHGLTGIQRVQIEYAKALMRANRGRASVFSNISDLYHDLSALFGEDEERTTSEVFGDIRRMYGLAVPLPFRPLMKLKLARSGVAAPGASNLRLGADDVLFVGGAFWAHPRSVQTYERAARAGCDIVVLFHDFIPLTFPDLCNARARPSFERMLRLPTRAIMVSEHTKRQFEEVRRTVGAPPSVHPPTVVPLAHEFSAAPRNHAAPEAPSLRTAMIDRMGAFALCVGSVDIRKNQARLLGLWESLAREGGPGWPKLVVAGKKGWRGGEAARILRRADPEAPYLWIEGPTDDELIWLYGRSSFTVFPSLAEGWGLPIGESLWFGKPCVASNAMSMPEVGGILCFYGDPHDIDTFAEPIIRLVRDPEFRARATAAIKASPLRTWAEAANEMAAAVSPPQRSSSRSSPGNGARENPRPGDRFPARA